MLASLGPDEARAAAAEGDAEVRCEFCGQRYSFTGAEIETLLELREQELAAPDRTQ